ncbi:MAG: MBOAT family protein, partial [Clostridia bacterium]|nr:MBOAT family protein [Clostridia bacterium]
MPCISIIRWKMVLTSVIYLAFLAGLVFLYYVAPKKIQWLLLLIASIIFIGFSISSPVVIWLIAYGIVITYFGAIFIEKQPNEKKKNRIKVITILLVLLELIALKYLSFLGMLLSNIGIHISEDTIKNMSILAPLGISFYSLISIGYILDVSRGVAKSQRNILKHALFILYFPQITSGPITRYSEMKESLFKKHELDFHNIYFGFQRILWGLFKKLVISERMAVIVNTVFDNYSKYSGLYIVIATFSFA